MSGPFLVLIFSASQAIRDIFFPHLFENHGFFDVVLIVFVSATASGWFVLLLLEPNQISRLTKLWKTLLLISIATATAWICYFFALTRIEPAVANTLFSGSGPFLVILVSFFANDEIWTYKRRRLEQLCYTGLFATMVAIVIVAITGHSGLDATTPWNAFLGSLSAIASGTLIATSLLISRRLNEAGLSANAIMAVRFSLGVLISAIIISTQEQPSDIALDWATLMVSVAALCLIVLPSYALQIGVTQAAPLTVQIIVSLSPLIVFSAQFLDGRTHYAPATLICVIMYGIFILSANVLRGWKNDPVK